MGRQHRNQVFDPPDLARSLDSMVIFVFAFFLLVAFATTEIDRITSFKSFSGFSRIFENERQFWRWLP